MTRILRKIFAKPFVVLTRTAMGIFLHQVRLGIKLTFSFYSAFFMPDITQVMTTFGDKMSEEEARVSLT